MQSNPGKLSYGSGGVGAPHHLYMDCSRATGTQMAHVPYKGSLPALDDVVGGHIQLMFCDIRRRPEVAAGKVRAFGVSTGSALPRIRHSDSGGSRRAGFDVAGWFMIVAPAKTPAIVDKLHDELLNVMASPTSRSASSSSAWCAADALGRRHGKLRQNRDRRWGKIVQQAGIAGAE